MYDASPASVTRAFWRWFWVGIGTLAVIGGVIYAGHEFGWWLSAQDTTHQAENTQNGYSNQTTLRGEATQDFATLTSIGVQIAGAKSDPSMTVELKTEQSATAAKVCGELNQINDGLPADQASWNTANCANGALSPTSPDYVTGAP